MTLQIKQNQQHMSRTIKFAIVINLKTRNVFSREYRRHKLPSLRLGETSPQRTAYGARLRWKNQEGGRRRRKWWYYISTLFLSLNIHLIGTYNRLHTIYNACYSYIQLRSSFLTLNNFMTIMPALKTIPFLYTVTNLTQFLSVTHKAVYVEGVRKRSLFIKFISYCGAL